jgi:hypothetical protein
MNFQLVQAFTTFEVTKNNQDSKITIQRTRNHGLMMTKKKVNSCNRCLLLFMNDQHNKKPKQHNKKS